MTQEDDGFAGYEPLDTFGRLDEVKEYTDSQREELISDASSVDVG